MKRIKESIYINMKESWAQFRLSNSLLKMVENIEKPYNNIAIVCIGTDRSTGDSYGPLIGHMLSKFTMYDFDLYGTLSEPVHALTLEKTIQQIDEENTLVIAIDSSVGYSSFVGQVGLKYGAIKPGSGVGKSLPAVGDIAISGIVAISGFAPLVMLQSAPLGMVYQMAEKTSHAINYVLYKQKMKNQSQKKWLDVYDTAVNK